VFEAGRQTRISQPLDCGRNIVLTGKGKKKKVAFAYDECRDCLRWIFH
jgi:hypothetical protein